jgi:hypothetical protein
MASMLQLLQILAGIRSMMNIILTEPCWVCSWETAAEISHSFLLLPIFVQYRYLCSILANIHVLITYILFIYHSLSWNLSKNLQDALTCPMGINCVIKMKLYLQIKVRFYSKLQQIAKNIKRMLAFFFLILNFHIFLSPNLANSFHGGLPLRLHHKIENK